MLPWHHTAPWTVLITARMTKRLNLTAHIAVSHLPSQRGRATDFDLAQRAILLYT
jgi:hypothetical protein